MPIRQNWRGDSGTCKGKLPVTTFWRTRASGNWKAALIINTDFQPTVVKTHCCALWETTEENRKWNLLNYTPLPARDH
jgi:hypothetical protein